MKFLIGKKVRATAEPVKGTVTHFIGGDGIIKQATEENALIDFCYNGESPSMKAWVPYSKIEKIYDERSSGDNHNSSAPGNITATEVRIRQQEHAREMAKMEMVSFLFPTENKKLPPIGSFVEVSLGKGEVKAHGNSAGRPVIFVQGFGWTETTCNWTELKGE